jgi:hypothetical protein
MSLFGTWLAETRKFQIEYYGRDYEALRSDPDLLGNTVQTQAGHIVWELGEMMAEYPGSKDWVSDRTALNRDLFLGEAVDALHFFANVLTALEFTDEELCEAYERKMQRNRERATSGVYDGVSDKCKICHRELMFVTTAGTASSIPICPEHGYGGCS